MMSRSTIVFLVLTIALFLSGCKGQSKKNVEEVSSTLNTLSSSSIEKDNISASSKISGSEPAPSSSPKFTSENMNQCTDFKVQGGRIYFSNKYDNGTLYSINIDGSEELKLNDDWTPQFCVSGDQIYYENGSDGSKLYAIATDGNDRRKLSDNKLVSIFWSVYEGRIYFSNHDDADSLYSIKVDGSDRIKLSSDSSCYMDVHGDRIYYYKSSGNKGIYSMKTDGSEKIKLSDDEPFRIVVAGDWIYYPNTKDSYKLYAMRTDGSDKHKVSDDYAPKMSVVNNRIYYQKGDDWRIFSVNIDGSDKKLLSDDHGDSFSVWDGRIYYTITGAKIYSMSTDDGNKQLLVDLSSNAYKDVTYEVSDRLHKDMPEYRFVAKGMTLGTEASGVGFVMGIKVFDEKEHPILSADFSETYDDEVLGNPVYNEMMDTMGLHLVDVNFDGYKDVIILEGFCGAHSNTWYNCWLWDPITSSFVESKSFAEICNPALNPEDKCIYSAGGSGAEFWGGSIYKYIDGEFIMTNNLDANSKGLTETELLNGKMVVVRKVSYNAEDKSEDAEMQYYKKSKLWQLDNPHWYMVGGHKADKWLGG